MISDISANATLPDMKQKTRKLAFSNAPRSKGRRRIHLSFVNTSQPFVPTSNSHSWSSTFCAK